MLWLGCIWLSLQAAGIDCTYVYGSLDQTARKINVAKFRKGKVDATLATSPWEWGVALICPACRIAMAGNRAGWGVQG